MLLFVDLPCVILEEVDPLIATGACDVLQELAVQLGCERVVHLLDS